MEIDTYRAGAETFLQELTGAYYRHYAGHEETYDIEPVYARHEALFERGQVLALRERHESTPEGSEARRLAAILLEFAVEGYLGLAIKRAEAELARREATTEIELDGERLGYREAAVAQANEDSRERREAIERARLDACEQELQPLYRELFERRQRAARELGYANYREACEATLAFSLTELAGQTHAFSDSTRERYPQMLEPELKRSLGIGIEALRRSDLPRFFRAPGADRHFPAEKLLRSLRETLAALGIGPQDNVVLDVEPRSGKSPRAFCAPVRIPERVYLVISPIGGRDDYSALFHEAGHTQYFAHVDPALPFEYRWRGDNAITECYAFLLAHLVENPAWLARRLGVAEAEELLSYARANRLVYLRRYAAKLDYELELHAVEHPGAEQARRYAELLGAGVQLPWPHEVFLADVDPGYYCACYLRAWALETHLRHHLTERFGELWFESAAAGETLRALWREGQRRSPEELLVQLGAGELDFGVMLEDLGV